MRKNILVNCALHTVGN